VVLPDTAHCIPDGQGLGQGLGSTIYSRFNIYLQEVLTIYEDAHRPGILSVSLHLARTPIVAAFGSSAGPLRESYPTASISDHHYKPGGDDQLNLQIDGAGAALKLLEDPNIVRAIRLFNLRLMKKGSCTYARYHCMDFADVLLSEGGRT
jgi:hypothetical protein